MEYIAITLMIVWFLLGGCVILGAIMHEKYIHGDNQPDIKEDK